MLSNEQAAREFRSGAGKTRGKPGRGYQTGLRLQLRANRLARTGFEAGAKPSDPVVRLSDDDRRRMRNARKAERRAT